MRIHSHDKDETLALGEAFARGLKPGDIVLLFGDLGSGKTTFTQGIARGLGFADYIRSPTFTLVNEYPGRLPIYHIDLYRLDTLEDVQALGIEEYLYGPGVTLVEWAEKLFCGKEPGFGIKSRFEVRLSASGENQRIIDILPIHMDRPACPDFPLQ